ncbi:MAG: TolC family protein [Pseudomonadota bacterium]
MSARSRILIGVRSAAFAACALLLAAPADVRAQTPAYAELELRSVYRPVLQQPPLPQVDGKKADRTKEPKPNAKKNASAPGGETEPSADISADLNERVVNDPAADATPQSGALGMDEIPPLVSILSYAQYEETQPTAEVPAPPADEKPKKWSKKNRPDPASIPIERQETLLDGDEEQYEAALSRPPVKTTNSRRFVNDALILPPNLAGTALSLRDVIIYTLKNNPDIGIARWQAEDSRAAIGGARAAYLPQVELSGATGLESTYNESGVGTYLLNRREASARVTQRIYDFGRSSQAIKRTKALYQARDLLFRDIVEDTLFQAISAYLDLLATSELLQNARDNVAAHERIVALVQLSFDGGNTSEAELKRARSRLDRARTAALDLENRREQAIGRFREVTGLEPGTLIEPRLDVGEAYALNEQSVDAIMSRSFLLQSILREGNSVRHQLKAVKRTFLPDVSIEVTGRYQDNLLGVTDFNTEGRAMLAATWTLYDGGAARARGKQLAAREREVEQRLLKERNLLKQDAFNIISVLRTSSDKTQILVEQVEASERVIDLYFKQFEAGRRTLLELLEAQAELAEAREENIANKFENMSASFASLRFQNVLAQQLADQLDFELTEVERAARR